MPYKITAKRVQYATMYFDEDKETANAKAMKEIVHTDGDFRTNDWEIISIDPITDEELIAEVYGDKVGS